MRRARPGDALAVRRLLKDLGYTGESRATDETVSHVLKHPEAVVFVAAAGLDVLGYVAVSVRPQMRLAGLLASVDELVVGTTRRGEGIGTKLLEAAVAHAKNMHCKRIDVLQSRARESYLRGFYQKHHFVEVDTAVMRIDLT